MMLFGALILCAGLIGIGMAKRISAKKGSADTMGYLLGGMFTVLGVIICWSTAGPWLLKGTGLIVLAVSGIAIMAATFYAVWSFAYTNAEFDKP